MASAKVDSMVAPRAGQLAPETLGQESAKQLEMLLDSEWGMLWVAWGKVALSVLQLGKML